MKREEDNKALCFTRFATPIIGIELPSRFTYPFYYQPHALSLLASNELQQRLEHHKNLNHNFGLDIDDNGNVIGKMFGVLVVKNKNEEIGYLSAFSGKLGGSNHHIGFVPPVFDILEENGFYRKGEEEIIKLTGRINELESDVKYLSCKELFASETEKSIVELTDLKCLIKQEKVIRDKKRKEEKRILSPDEYKLLEDALSKVSSEYNFQYKDLMRYWKRRLDEIEDNLKNYQSEIELIKNERKTKSLELQQRLFGNYYFLNKKGEVKSLLDIFKEGIDSYPPSGAGECAAPKLLHYAYQNELHPLAMAEFWWGQSPVSEIRKHKQYYPACKGKCEPILTHMLEGLVIDENPMMHYPSIGQEVSYIYEDEYLAVIGKPAEFLSVPGKKLIDSIYKRVLTKYPEATGPLIVHRLDMSTSGLMVIAKTKEVHENLQRQFLKRSIKKRYVAIVEGTINDEEGIIELPLRVDLDDRPRQLVCYEHGKSALTKWKVVNRINEKLTKIHFYPMTGRTHQLRVHAAHSLGLNAPIVGDDLYGNKNDRLYLHSEAIEFKHPISNEVLNFELKAEF